MRLLSKDAPVGRTLSLNTRISLVLTILVGTLLVIQAVAWVRGARSAIHEEIEAASRVSEQWLVALGIELRKGPEETLSQRILSAI